MNKENSKINNNEIKAIQDEDLGNVTGGTGFLPHEECPYHCGGTLVYNRTDENEIAVYIWTKCSVCGHDFAYEIKK